jgi:hypothetical protein
MCLFFEDIVNDAEAAKVFFEGLDRLKVHLSELVARYLGISNSIWIFLDYWLRWEVEEMNERVWI